MAWQKRRSKEANIALARKIALRAHKFECRTLWAGKTLDNNRIGIGLWAIAHRLARRGGMDSAAPLAGY